MSVFGKPLDQVTEADLQALVQNQVRERQTLEFKRDPYPTNDKGKREMLRDISSMANAYGGEVLIGLAETGDGIASGVVGISDGERMAQSIESSCLSNIDERIGGLKTQAVLLANRKHVVIIQIPQSLRMPHMVTFQGLNQFWIRHDRQKSPMSTDEIREACLRVEMLTEKLEAYLTRHLAAAEQFSPGKPNMAVSLTPMLVQKEIIQTKNQKLREMLRDCPLGDGYMPRPCLDGLENVRIPGTRLQLHRNGHLSLWEDLTHYIKVPAVSGHESERFLLGDEVISTVLKLFQLGKAVYEYCDVSGSVFAKMDFWGIQGIFLRGKSRTRIPGEPGQWFSDALHLDPLEVATLQDPTAAAKVILDRLWEAFGFDEAPFGGTTKG